MTVTTEWLTAQQQCTWRRFLRTVSLLDQALDRQLQRDAGMPLAYYSLLAMLSEAPGATLRMSRLAELTSQSASRVSHAVAKLEAAGLVTRSKCPVDRRGSYAQLTPAGLEAVTGAAPGHVSAVREFLFDRLSCEQVQQLSELCDAVLTPGPQTP